MKRRAFIAGLGGAAAAGSVFWPVLARPEVSSKRPTIAWIAPGTREVGASFIESFLRGMREFGHVEERSFDMVYRFGDGYQERLPALAEEVIRLKPDVILASAVAATVAVRRATSRIPIVTPALADAVHLGLIVSEARPAGNVTRIEHSIAGLPAKQIEFAREIVPDASTIGLLTNLMDPKAPPQAKELEAAARTANIKIVSADANEPDQIDGALRNLNNERPDAVI